MSLQNDLLWFGGLQKLSASWQEWLGFLGGCGHSNKPSPPQARLADQLLVKYNKYKELYKEEQDKYGFIESSHCDALLWTGLLGSVLPEGIDITAARLWDGRWTRRPLFDGRDTCYPGGSRSSISRDMFTGLMWYMWRNKRLDLAEDLWQYGKANDWVMGKGAASRIVFMPGNQADLAEMIYRLGGKNRPISKNIPQFRTKNTGFPAHLDALAILLRAEMLGEMDKSSLALMKHHSERVPENSFFSYIYHKYTDGNYDQAIKTMLNEKYFPSDRLPTKGDRWETWLWQRDPGVWWDKVPNAPDQEGIKHAGGDLLFVAHLILSDLGMLYETTR
jgi:hypothetical protein